MEKDPIEVIIKRKNLPDKPGIYIYKDVDGTIIYIGKAKSLIKRVSQYFQSKNFNNSREEILYGQKIKNLVANIADLDYIVTESEKEALILENDMIKKHQPHYNAMLKDDKSFPWILITYSEQFPRILIVRQPKKIKNFDNKNIRKTKNKFFGPYIDVRPMKQTLKLLRKYFPYCTCKKPCKKKSRPCINYQIGLCPAPCNDKMNQKDYLDNIKSIDRILDGDIDGIIDELKLKMNNSSKNQEFEIAAKYRDAIRALKQMTEKQAIVNYDQSEKINRDIIGFHKTLKKIGILIMHVRDGRLIGKTPNIIDSDQKLGKDQELLFSILEQYYLSGSRSLPDEVILPDIFFKRDGSELGIDVAYIKTWIKNLQHAVKESRGKKVKIRPKGTGSYTNSLLRIAQRNVQLMIKLENEYDKMMTEAEVLSDLGMDKKTVAYMKKQDREALVGLKEIQGLLSLPSIPNIIEGFDISSWQQGDATGAMVCFINGKPSKSNYRSYTIKNLTLQGDFAMMQEVIKRRYKRVIKENGVLPDLIIMDGGKAQVNAALEILETLDLKIPVIGLEKKKTHTEIDRVVFLEQHDGSEKKLLEKRLKEYTEGYNILQNISQEYHRRAIQHHRKRMAKRILKSPLDEVKGIGEKTKIKILQHFETIDNVMIAKLEEFQTLLGKKRGETIFTNIKDYFNQ